MIPVFGNRCRTRSPYLSCSLPGVVYTDRTGEGGTQPNNDIASFGIAEPENMPGKLVFVINNADPSATAAANSDYYVFFDPPRGGKSYKLSLRDMAVTFYKNGQFVSDCGAPPISQCRRWDPEGPLPPDQGCSVSTPSSSNFLQRRAGSVLDPDVEEPCRGPRYTRSAL